MSSLAGCHWPQQISAASVCTNVYMSWHHSTCLIFFPPVTKIPGRQHLCSDSRGQLYMPAFRLITFRRRSHALIACSHCRHGQDKTVQFATVQSQIHWRLLKTCKLETGSRQDITVLSCLQLCSHRRHLQDKSWTPRKPSWSGSALDSSSPSSRWRNSNWLRELSSSTQWSRILVSFWTINYPWVRRSLPFPDLAFTSCVSYTLFDDLWHRTHWDRWYKHSYIAGWTTATLCWQE